MRGNTLTVHQPRSGCRDLHIATRSAPPFPPSSNRSMSWETKPDIQTAEIRATRSKNIFKIKKTTKKLAFQETIWIQTLRSCSHPLCSIHPSCFGLEIRQRGGEKGKEKKKERKKKGAILQLMSRERLLAKWSSNHLKFRRSREEPVCSSRAAQAQRFPELHTQQFAASPAPLPPLLQPAPRPKTPGRFLHRKVTQGFVPKPLQLQRWVSATQAQGALKSIATLQSHPPFLGFPAKSQPRRWWCLLHRYMDRPTHRMGLLRGPVGVEESAGEHTVAAPGANLSLGNPGHAQNQPLSIPGSHGCIREQAG